MLVALEDNRETLKPQTNIVLMGQGEPLLNYDAVIAALRILLDQKGVAIAPRHASLSTSGIVPGIERLAQEKVRPNLAISLNASSNEQRDQVMPINRKYPLEKLLDACRKYPLKPREWLMFEYVLLGGFNDSVEDARRVVKLAGEYSREGEFDSVESGRFAVEAAGAAARGRISERADREGRAVLRARFARAGRDGGLRAIGAGRGSRYLIPMAAIRRPVVFSRR